MQRILTTLTIFLLIFCSNCLYAQAADTSRLAKTDTTHASVTPISDTSYTADDDMPFAIVVAAMLLGVAAASAFIALGLAALATILITMGIISASLLVGFYTKSVKAGFKTLVVIASAVGGAVIGGVGLFLIVKFFHLHLSYQSALVTGSLSGLGGGILTGFIIYRVIIYMLQYARKKLGLA